MELTITGKNMQISDRIREYVEKKASKLDRYLKNIDEASLELTRSSAKSAEDRHIAQLTVRVRGSILRAEERAADVFTAFDAVLDKMYRQIVRYKTRKRARGRIQEDELMPPLEEYEEEAPRQIVRTKRFLVLPMDEEEAAEQMELLGHDFFLFLNTGTGDLNIIYRRRDGDYGLLEPELA
ncbi:MAG TPA: ribosome-associated translation inhibitor RaiA [Anaerolineae bacterium]|nr:ribosome-associated translation inhibitor RaiA [Anaerolineae bacterium]